MSKTVGFQFNVLKSNIEEAALVMFDQFRPAIMGGVAAMQNIVKWFTRLDPETHKMVKNATLVAGGIAGVSLALATLGKAIGVVLSPLLLKIAAVTAVVGVFAAGAALVVDNWGAVSDFFGTFFDWIKTGVISTGKIIATGLTAPFRLVGGVVDAAIGTMATKGERGPEGNLTY